VSFILLVCVYHFIVYFYLLSCQLHLCEINCMYIVLTATVFFIVLIIYLVSDLWSFSNLQSDSDIEINVVVITLRAKLSSAVYCNRSCVFVGLFCLWICYHDNSKLRASIFTKLVKVVTISSWLNFGRPAACAPGKGVYGGVKIFGSALLQPTRSVCDSLSVFFHSCSFWKVE